MHKIEIIILCTVLIYLTYYNLDNMSADINFHDEILRKLEKDITTWINNNNYAKTSCHCNDSIKKCGILYKLKYCETCNCCRVSLYPKNGCLHQCSFIVFRTETRLDINFWPISCERIMIRHEYGVEHYLNLEADNIISIDMYNVYDIFNYLKNIFNKKKQTTKQRIDDYFQSIPTSTIQYMLDYINPDKEIIIDI